jgi:hypothetical protein
MDPHLKVMLFISIGGITMFLPLMFIESMRMTVRNIFLMLILFLGLSLLFSGVVALGGKCDFLETLLMKGSQCNFLPFANTRTVPVTNGLAFIFLVLLFIAVLLDLILKLTRKHNDTHNKLFVQTPEPVHRFLVMRWRRGTTIR